MEERSESRIEISQNFEERVFCRPSEDIYTLLPGHPRWVPRFEWYIPIANYFQAKFSSQYPELAEHYKIQVQRLYLIDYEIDNLENHSLLSFQLKVQYLRPQIHCPRCKGITVKQRQNQVWNCSSNSCESEQSGSANHCDSCGYRYCENCVLELEEFDRENGTFRFCFHCGGQCGEVEEREESLDSGDEYTTPTCSCGRQRDIWHCQNSGCSLYSCGRCLVQMQQSMFSDFIYNSLVQNGAENEIVLHQNFKNLVLNTYDTFDVVHPAGIDRSMKLIDPDEINLKELLPAYQKTHFKSSHESLLFKYCRYEKLNIFDDLEDQCKSQYFQRQYWPNFDEENDVLNPHVESIIFEFAYGKEDVKEMVEHNLMKKLDKEKPTQTEVLISYLSGYGTIFVLLVMMIDVCIGHSTTLYVISIFIIFIMTWHLFILLKLYLKAKRVVDYHMDYRFFHGLELYPKQVFSDLRRLSFLPDIDYKFSSNIDPNDNTLNFSARLFKQVSALIFVFTITMYNILMYTNDKDYIYICQFIFLIRDFVFGYYYVIFMCFMVSSCLLYCCGLPERHENKYYSGWKKYCIPFCNVMLVLYCIIRFATNIQNVQQSVCYGTPESLCLPSNPCEWHSSKSLFGPGERGYCHEFFEYNKHMDNTTYTVVDANDTNAIFSNITLDYYNVDTKNFSNENIIPVGQNGTVFSFNVSDITMINETLWKLEATYTDKHPDEMSEFFGIYMIIIYFFGMFIYYYLFHKHTVRYPEFRGSILGRTRRPTSRPYVSKECSFMDQLRFFMSLLYINGINSIVDQETFDEYFIKNPPKLPTPLLYVLRS